MSQMPAKKKQLYMYFSKKTICYSLQVLGFLSMHSPLPNLPSQATSLQAVPLPRYQNMTASMVGCLVYGCFLKWWYPQNTPSHDHFLVEKPHGFVGETHHFRKPPYENRSMGQLRWWADGEFHGRDNIPKKTQPKWMQEMGRFPYQPTDLLGSFSGCVRCQVHPQIPGISEKFTSADVRRRELVLFSSRCGRTSQPWLGKFPRAESEKEICMYTVYMVNIWWI